MERKIYIILVAGGSGVRMGAAIPKQFLPLGGKPVLLRSAERIFEAFPDADLVTVLPKAHFETWKKICRDYEFNHPQRLVEGGITRFHSVKNALAVIPDGAVVAVHDGVRPLVSVNLLRRMRAAMDGARALVPSLKVVDSLKFADGTLPEPDRSKIIAVQTPQMFLSEELKDAYTQPYDLIFTDDASVAVRKGIPLSYVDGERFNLKITTPEDLVLAELLLTSDIL